MEMGCYWVWPAGTLPVDPRSGVRGRHHVHEVTAERSVQRSEMLAGFAKKVTDHALRHRIATQLLLREVDMRSVQALLGHAEVRTTLIDTKPARAMRGEITSPLDDL